MYLSRKGEYGLLALVDLALHESDERVQAADIAARHHIPKQYLDQLLVALKRAGLIASSRGRSGGYRLARPSNAITIYDAVLALEGPIANTAFRQDRIADPARTELARVWDDASSRFQETLKGKTLEQVARQAGSLDAMLTYEI